MNQKLHIDKLIQVAANKLPDMLQQNGLFCEEVIYSMNDKYMCSGESLRYSIMVLIGLNRALKNGYKIEIQSNAILNKLLSKIDDFSIGDLGLLLWYYNLIGNPESSVLYQTIERKLYKTNWDSIINMEIAWLITGLSYHQAYHNEGINLTDELTEYLMTNRSSTSGLFYHMGKGFRRDYPNFASQIYSIHALSLRCRLLSDKNAGDRAIEATKALTPLQQSNGGWPWLFRASTGSVIEPYELYSVHQDAMAPMALFELKESTGFNSLDMIRQGIKWMYRDNELNQKMYTDNFIFRSIRRTKPYDRISIYKNIIYDRLRIHNSNNYRNGFLEINPTSRPYHLGWILEAWCGRENDLN